MNAPKISPRLRSKAIGARWMPNASPARIFWLRPIESVASQNLRGKFIQNGLTVRVFDSYDALGTLYDEGVDLCIIESANQSVKEVKVLVNCIRAHSRVPVILLSDQNSIDWIIQMLVAGVDAVVPTQTPDDIILARAKALLRRWTPRHTS